MSPIAFYVGDLVDHDPFYAVSNKGRGKVISISPSGSLLQVAWFSNGKTTTQGCRTLKRVGRPALELFKAGDRVRYVSPTSSPQLGVVVQDTRGGESTLVKLDTESYSNFRHNSTLTLSPPLENTAPFVVERAKPLFEAGDRIRYADGVRPYRDGVVVHRSYLGSKDILVKLDSYAYTMWARPQFLTKLPPLENTAPFVVFDEAAPVDPKVYERAGYWHDLALRERDAARAEVKRLHDVCTGFRTELSNQDEEIRQLKEEVDLWKRRRQDSHDFGVNMNESADRLRRANVTLRETIANAQRALEHKS